MSPRILACRPDEPALIANDQTMTGRTPDGMFRFEKRIGDSCHANVIPVDVQNTVRYNVPEKGGL